MSVRYLRPVAHAGEHSCPSSNPRIRTLIAGLLTAAVAACGGGGGGGNDYVPPPTMATAAPAPVADPAPASAAPAPVALAPVVPARAPATSISRIAFAQSHVLPSDDFQMLLVRNKEVLVMVSVTTREPMAPKPAGTLTVTNSAGAVRFSGNLNAPSSAIPAVLPSVPRFEDTYTITIPAQHVVPGMRVNVRLAKNDSVLTGWAAPRVGAENAVAVVAVPVRIGATVGRLPPGLDAALLQRAPVASVRLTTRAAYTSTTVTALPANEDDWGDTMSNILTELIGVRALETGNRRTYYYGLLPKATLGLVGFGQLPGNVAVGASLLNRPDVMRDTFVHELGHNFSLPHAPCGDPADPDPYYPYANARLGSGARMIWGYRADERTFVNPTEANRHDLMSYCEGDTFSDYNYRKIQSWLTPADRLGFEASQQEAMQVPEELLLFVGLIRGGTRVELHPVKSFRGTAQEATSGEYVLRLTTSTGVSDHPFTPGELDHNAGTTTFALSVRNPGTIVKLQILRNGQVLMERPSATAATARAAPQRAEANVAGPQVSFSEKNGQLVLTWNRSSYPYLTVTHVGSARTTLAQDLPGGQASLPIDKLPAGGSFEFILSDGLNSIRTQQSR